VATTVDKGHGRVEKRTLRTTAVLTVHERWRGLAQGFELRRERTVQGVTTVEIEYGITSLQPEQASAERLLALVRDHWRIENSLHYVRDVTLGEDACRVRKGSAPQVLAGLRNAVVHLLAGVDAPSRPAALEQLSVRPAEALELIGAASLE
jgi:DDE family transposase